MCGVMGIKEFGMSREITMTVQQTSITLVGVLLLLACLLVEKLVEHTITRLVVVNM